MKRRNLTLDTVPTIKVDALDLPDIYENKRTTGHGPPRWDRKYRGQITVNGNTLPIVVHLLAQGNYDNPNGNWGMTVHLNATDIYQGTAQKPGEYWDHDNCERCDPSDEDEITDNYATPGDTRDAVLPAVRSWLAGRGVLVKFSEFDNCHTYFLAKPRRARKQKVTGHLPAYAENQWRCHCPVHGKFAYIIEESMGM